MYVLRACYLRIGQKDCTLPHGKTLIVVSSSYVIIECLLEVVNGTDAGRLPEKMYF